jgi:uncharacterized iron-regulated membrane protein
MKSKFKKRIRFLHLWLGLITGAIVFVVATTGCIYAFQQEIQNAAQDYRFVARQDAPMLPPSKFQAIAREALPGKLLHAIKYNTPDKAVEAIYYNYDPEYYYIAYLDPYSGKVLAVINQDKTFFRFILDGHFYLWLPHEPGQIVVATSSLIFLAMLVTGIILWWPKNKKAAKQRFWFRWKDGLKWKRKNYDLHNITGFYISVLALIFALTGLVWGFQWFAFTYYTVAGGQKSLVYQDPGSEKGVAWATVANPLDKVWLKMQKDYPQAKSIEVHPPESDSTSIAANANPEDGTYWKIDYRYYDQYSLEEKKVSHIYGRLPDADTSDKLMRMNYDIHTGAILGLPGKILAFFISLLVATLPVTGVLVWIGRTKKAKKEKTA